jgi:hypothetical protein
MGRRSTGAWTVYESTRLELSYLIRNGYIKKNCIGSGQLAWDNGLGQRTATMGFKSSYLMDEDEKYVELTYTVTARDGQETHYNYRIYFVEVPSNLGKGKVLYFQCPRTRRKCRILYMAYGYPQFMCRQAYKYRLYYDCQITSKLNKYNDAYWRLESHLKKIEGPSCYGSRTYRGELTKTAKRYCRLYEKQAWNEKARWTLGMPLSLLKYALKDI